MKKTLRLVSLCLAALLAVSCMPALAAEMIFEGKVAIGQTYSIAAPFGGFVNDLTFQPGDRIEKGDLVARIDTTSVYSPIEGTISGVFGLEGDSTESVTERYGAVMYIEPIDKYIVSASTDKAYDNSANKYIHIGETVYLSCTADGSHVGTGRIMSVGEDGTSYKVEVTGGEFLIGETVNVFRKPGYASASRIGRGTVAAAAAVAVKGSGSILKILVENGDTVERGEKLFETVEGALDGLFAPGDTVISEIAGIVTAADATSGSTVAKGAKILTVCPDSELHVEIGVTESDLNGIYVGQPVAIEFSWDPEQETRMNGSVTHISYVNSAETGEPVYTAHVSFTPDQTVRLGMTVIVYTLSAAPEETAAEAPETTQAQTNQDTPVEGE